MTSNTSSLLVSLGALGAYSYSMYFLYTPEVLNGFNQTNPKPLLKYGLFRWLTVQCLLVQIINSFLHVLAHFVKSLRGLRDLVFTTVAVPVGSIVVYSFWLVWFIMGRELIFPSKLDEFYPSWQNHVNHTIIVPINLLLTIQIRHKYFKNAALITILYKICYTVFLYVVKAQTGLSVYSYLDQLDEPVRFLYFVATGLSAYLMYKLGQLITYIAHGPESEEAARKSSKGKKQS